MNREELLKVAKPILFNTEMVRAILDGRKTATRRIIKYPPRGYFENEPPKVKGRYNSGDILYVRETWVDEKLDYPELDHCYHYKADGEKFYNTDGSRSIIKWRPSIHMPKEAARIFLEVTDVRVKRLQRCGEGLCVGIENEGIITPLDPILYISDDEYHKALREQFITLWNSTIPKKQLDTYGWGANPWVWVIGFERIEPDDERRIV